MRGETRTFYSVTLFDFWDATPQRTTWFATKWRAQRFRDEFADKGSKVEIKRIEIPLKKADFAQWLTDEFGSE